MSTIRLPRFGSDWRARWLVLPSWNRLHRVAAITWQRGEGRQVGYGVTACGRFDKLQMPGVLSRTGLPRCAYCCRIAGVPRGEGAPFNEGIDA